MTPAHKAMITHITYPLIRGLDRAGYDQGNNLIQRILVRAKNKLAIEPNMPNANGNA